MKLIWFILNRMYLCQIKIIIYIVGIQVLCKCVSHDDIISALKVAASAMIEKEVFEFDSLVFHDDDKAHGLRTVYCANTLQTQDQFFNAVYLR